MKQRPDINARLFNQIELLLADLESGDLEISFPQRLNALIAIGRIQIMFANLRKYAVFYEQSDSGAKVREYSSAFTEAASGARRRKKFAGPSASDIIELDDFGNSADDDDSDSAA